ncbi:hypothetical protein A0H81_07701 [Grifola frondosa]|uniref:Uncharacterized protein n=1 Tax=Grifola frondosa TaxID=5627 RepID=A0A1C7M774_GRIFR|nr:hypothetical protein A0H81_07701 [Grifola frondosa]
MIPPHSNPHLLSQSLAFVSRAELDNSEDEALAESVAENADTEHAQRVARLVKLVKRSIEFEVLPPGSLEFQRKSKRRRIHEVVESLECSPESVPFRLISRTLPPRDVSLQYKPASILIVKEPSCEDNEEEAESRKLKAQAAAVDFEWVISQSNSLRHPPRKNADKLLLVTAELPSPPPPIMVAERLRPASPKSSLSSHTDAEPSPHEISTEFSYPIVDITASPFSETGHPHRRRRHRRKFQAVKPRPPAMFWRPPLLGGKTQDMPWATKVLTYNRKNDPRRYSYHRDTMRRGTFVS